MNHFMLLKDKMKTRCLTNVLKMRYVLNEQHFCRDFFINKRKLLSSYDFSSVLLYFADSQGLKVKFVL
jgi:hypothetical protein